MSRHYKPFSHNSLKRSERQAANLWDAGHSIDQIAKIMDIERHHAGGLVKIIHTGDEQLRLTATRSQKGSQQLADALANYVGSAA